MAAWGLLCNICHIHLAPEYPEIAQKLVEGFKGMWVNVKPEDFSCEGCWGEDDEMWSPDCEIRKCSKDKNWNYCNECYEFPCQKLKDWSKKERSYEEALERLKNIKKK